MNDTAARSSTADLHASSEDRQPLQQYAPLVDGRRETTPDQNGRPSLELRDFSVYYGGFHAVKKVSVDFPKEQVSAIIGPSGCGKSTLLNAINRMTDLIAGCRTEGQMLYEGRNLFGDDMDVIWLRRRIGMVFQKPNPFPKSIYDNVAYGPRLHGMTDKAELDHVVERSLKEAALWNEVKDRLRDNALGLSGGQAQRLCIARALAIEPKIVLLDEPTSALDPRSTSHIEDLIAQIQDHYTVIIVTHNMQQAARVSDIVLFMYEGELVESNDTKNFFMNPEKKASRDYITGRFS